mmetsp:Transcript_62263/g.166474  ORF Transcript_62263/g.166474 Transcript_62263/m.166474 type:complete len:338 (-) Transcript_62263:136-1149(-)
MVPAVHEEPQAPLPQILGQALQELLEERSLGAGTAYGHEEAPRQLGLAAPLKPGLAVRDRVGAEVVGHPVAREAEACRWTAHIEQLVKVRGGLHQIQGAGHDHEVLWIVVEDKVDDFLEPASDRHVPDDGVRADDGDVPRQARKDGAYLLPQHEHEAEHVHVGLEGHPPPDRIDRATKLGCQPRHPRVVLVHALDDIGLDAVWRQDVHQVRLQALRQCPRQGRVGDAVVSVAHPYRSNDDPLAARERAQHLPGVGGRSRLQQLQALDNRGGLGDEVDDPLRGVGQRKPAHAHPHHEADVQVVGARGLHFEVLLHLSLRPRLLALSAAANPPLLKVLR